MFTQKFLAVAGLASMVLSTHTSAQPLAMAKPEGQWIVDFADDHCLAGHKFITSYGDTIFQFQPDMMRRNATINIIVPKGPLTDRQWGDMKVDWPGREDDKDHPPQFQVLKLKNGNRVVTFSIPTDGLEATQSVDLQISFQRNPGFSFRLPLWTDIKTLLDQCASDLRVSKGFPGAEYDKASVHAKAKVWKYFHDGDYPYAAMKNGEQGDVWVVYWVEADGRVSGCTIDKSSGSEALDAKTCEIIRKVKFQPALSKDGTPIREPSSTRLRWRMPY